MSDTSENVMIVRVPYGTHEAGITTVGLNSDDEYRGYFKKAVEGEPPGGKQQSYVYPKRSMRQAEAHRNLRLLTEWPVVYIVCFEQTEKMKRAKWLKKAVGDDGEDKAKLYDRDYVVYVGETNDIIRRTNQHLTAGPHKRAGDIGFEETYDDIEAEVDERTKADRVIQEAVKSPDVKVWQYVIWDEYFTKSMTLDMEHKFIDYAFSLENVYTLNGRGNPQHNYFKSEEKDAVCSTVWQALSLSNDDLFPPEHDIWNSELFKVSPFHSLGKEQSAAVNEICESAQRLLSGEPICGETLQPATSDHRLIVVDGASGTGKSIVLSTLFVRLSEALRENGASAMDYGIKPNSRVCLVVNQDQQETLYTNLAQKIGLMRTANGADKCVYKATPFLNAVRDGKREMPDVVLVDEAHLLRMAAHRSYPKTYHGNQLYDILLNAKVVVAVLDPVQVMRKSQQWDQAELDALLPEATAGNGGRIAYTGAVELSSHGEGCAQGCDTFNAYRVTLTEQFRMDAGEELIAWIDRLADVHAVGIQPVPEDSKNRANATFGAFELKVFGSPKSLAAAIDAKRNQVREQQKRNKKNERFGSSLCRLLATYDWGYSTSSAEGAVELYKVKGANGVIHWAMPNEGKAPEGFSGDKEDVFSRPWNYVDSDAKGKQVWSADSAADEEVGSYFSVQGFDLNYAGVIIGPSITYRNQRIVVDASKSHDADIKGPLAERLIVQQLKVLLRRGMHGLYLFAVDPELQEALTLAAKVGGCYYE